MLPLSFATALLGLVFVLAPQFSSAGLIQGPTGIEYVKRFAASPQPDALCLRCIIMDGGDNGTREPDTPLGTSILLGAIPYIRCSYSKTNIQAVRTAGCSYRNDNGAELATNNAQCALKATSCTPGARRKREETELERIIRERQWKGPPRPKKRAV